MKHSFFFIMSALCLPFTVIAQNRYDTPGYTPLEPRLFVLQHKVNSDRKSPVAVTLESFSSQTPVEDINIFTIYQMTDGLGKASPACWTPPPPKLMDLFIIYRYSYLIPCTSLEQCNSLLPAILLGKEDELIKLKLTKYYLADGKVRNSKISNKQVTKEQFVNELKLRINKCEFETNSLLELVVEIQSANFNLVNPTLNNHSTFARTVTLSIPSIFQYDFPDDHHEQELVSKENNPFKLLKFNRTSKEWDEVIEIFEVDCNTYSWKLPPEAEKIPDFNFHLSNFHIPNDNDIGVPCDELIKSIFQH